MVGSDEFKTSSSRRAPPGEEKRATQRNADAQGGRSQRRGSPFQLKALEARTQVTSGSSGQPGASSAHADAELGNLAHSSYACAQVQPRADGAGTIPSEEISTHPDVCIGHAPSRMQRHGLAR